MYEYVKGPLVEKSPHHVVVDINGIGYKLIIPSRHFFKLPDLGEFVLLYTSWVIRELSQTLYGFLERHDRSLFEQLLAISGIGPKTSLALLGHYTVPEIEKIVCSDDPSSLAEVPGIGKKTAEKLIVDLRGRLKISTPSPRKESHPSRTQDAFSALIRLGYSQPQAEQAVFRALQELPAEADLSIVITTALKMQR